MCSYINMSHVQWADFLSHFSEPISNKDEEKKDDGEKDEIS